MKITVIDSVSCCIDSPEFSFVYNDPDVICKPEYKGKYTNFGGLQCGFKEGSKEYEELYINLIVIAKSAINVWKLKKMLDENQS